MWKYEGQKRKTKYLKNIANRSNFSKLYLFDRISKTTKQTSLNHFDHSMDPSLHRHSTLPDGSAAGDPAVVVPPEPSISGATDVHQPTSKRNVKNQKKKKEAVASDNASVDSSSNCSSTASYSQKGIKIPRNPKAIRVGRRGGLTDADALGLPLGMSIAAVVAQVFKFLFFFIFSHKNSEKN